MIGLEYIRDLNYDTVDSLAEKLHVTKGLISQWENRKVVIPNKRLDELSKLYNTPKEYFSKELTRIDKLYLQKNMFLDAIATGDEASVDKDKHIMNTINSLSTYLNKPKQELLKNVQAVIEFEELIQKIYDISGVFYSEQASITNSIVSATAIDYDAISIINQMISLIEKDWYNLLIKKFISLIETEDETFILSIFKAAEISQIEDTSTEIHNNLVKKLVPIFREWKDEEKKRKEAEYQEYKELFGLDDESEET